MSNDQPAAPAPQPTVAELQAEIESARADLVVSLGELKAQTAPGALAGRAGRRVKGLFVDEFGGLRPERVAIAGAVVVAIVAIGIWRRRR